jgi:antitoxin (DNA-binding transcriptional repressor) of toxin-antitoxin stability system
MLNVQNEVSMKSLNLSEVRKNLPTLASEVSTSRKPLLITRRGQPLAMLVPCAEDESDEPSQRFSLRGLPVEMAPDFDEPLDEIWEAMST